MITSSMEANAEHARGETGRLFRLGMDTLAIAEKLSCPQALAERHLNAWMDRRHAVRRSLPVNRG